MFYNLLIMTATTLLMRFVGVTFNVYITNRIGSLGIGLFTLVMSVGGFAVTFATSGVNLAATRLTAEAMGRGDELAVRQAMRRCIIYSLCFGITASVGLLLLSKPIALCILKDERCILPLRLFSVSLPCISLSSAMNGYFTAQRRVIKNAATGFFEQFIKITVTVYAVGILAPKGIEYACVAVILGGMTAELSSFVFTYVMYKRDLKKHNRRSGLGDATLTRKLFGIALPIAFTTYVRSGLVTVEHLLIPWGLKKQGSSVERALSSYGMLHGMVFPIILFPQAVLSAFAGLLVPEVSECMAAGEYARIERISSRVIQSALAFGIGVSGIMLCYSSLLGQAIYQSDEASAFICLLSPLIPVMYLDHVVDGLLKGLGEQLYCMRVNITDAAMSVLLVWLFVPISGIYGYIMIVIAMEIVNTALSLIRLMSRVNVRVELGKWIVKPLLCIIGATSLSGILTTVITPGSLGVAVDAFISVSVCALIYFILLRILGSVSRDDIRWFRSAIR